MNLLQQFVSLFFGICVFFPLLSPVCHAQTIWQKIYPGYNGYYLPSFANPTTDGGFIMMADQPISGNPANIFKTDGDGVVQWSRRYTANGTPVRGADIIQTSDGGYLHVGTMFVSGRFNDLCAIKLDASGNIVWTQILGTTNRDGNVDPNSCGPTSRRMPIIETPDGGFVFGSCTEAIGKYAGYLNKLDASGNLLWSRRYEQSTTSDDWIVGLELTSDGGCAVLMASFDIFSQSGFMVVKTDNLGNAQWSNFYNNNSVSACNPRSGQIRQTDDGGYLLCGPKKFPRAPYMIKLDALGSIDWARSYNSSGFDQETMDFVQDPNGDIVMACRGSSGGWRTMGMKVNSDGSNVIWAKYYRPTEQGWADQIRNLPGGYMMTGVSRSGSALGVHMMSMNLDGVTGCGELSINPVISNDAIVVTPRGLSSNVATTTVPAAGAFTSSSPASDIVCPPLDGEELSLIAWPEMGNVRLEWEVPEAIEISSLSMERSLNLIGWMEPGMGELEGNSFAYNYSVPKNLTLFYRLRAVDPNGNTHFSNVVEVQLEGKGSSWTLLPNPVVQGEPFSVLGSLEGAGPVDIRLLDALGRELLQKEVAGTTGPNRFEIETDGLAAGPYWIQILGPKQRITLKGIVR